MQRSCEKILSGCYKNFFKFYRLLIAPALMVMGTRCRFQPSCSHYAEQVFQEQGIVRGSILAMYRILRCQPFCKGGYDPVPARRL